MLSLPDYGAASFAELRDRLDEDQGVTLALGDAGVLHLERPLPCLAVYRAGSQGRDRIFDVLDRTEPAYLNLQDDVDPGFYGFFACLVEYLGRRYTGMVIVQIWLDPEAEADVTIQGPEPSTGSALETLYDALAGAKFDHFRLHARQEIAERPGPGSMPELLSDGDRRAQNVLLLGLKLKPFYIAPETGRIYPGLARWFRRRLSIALRKAFFEFINLNTPSRVTHFHVLGTTRLDDRTRAVDRDLDAIAREFELLRLITPINPGEAWREFRECNYRTAPVFHYRLVPVDPEAEMRRLYDIRIERIEDPTLAYLFREKREELAKMLAMLRDRDKPDFRFSSMQVYGIVDDDLLRTAQHLLEATAEPAEPADDVSLVDAGYVARCAEREFEYLRRQYPEFDSEIFIRDDVSGMLVSNGRLFIEKNGRIPRRRVDPLIQHEVGTHILTAQNGKAQPLQLLSNGVPGYEALQEGLAVLAEYLVEGLTRARLRMLAGRVVGVHRRIGGHSFTDCFALLHEEHAFEPQLAFRMTMRIYRSGGLTKDAIYLKGLLELLDYLRQGHDLEPLLIGKIRVDFLPIVQELIYRRILTEPPLRPRYLVEQTPAFARKMARLREGATPRDLIAR